MAQSLNAVATQAWRLWKSDSRIETVVAIGMVGGAILLTFGPDIIRLVRGAI